MTFDELHEATEPWRAARNLEARLRPGRDELIRRALAEGMGQREAARAVDVSHGLPAIVKAQQAG